jgi:hypothetical protein
MRLKIRGTVSTLWANTSGRDSNTVSSGVGSLEVVDEQLDAAVPGLSSRIWRHVSAYSQDAPSGRSSRATPVTVA